MDVLIHQPSRIYNLHAADTLPHCLLFLIGHVHGGEKRFVNKQRLYRVATARSVRIKYAFVAGVLSRMELSKTIWIREAIYARQLQGSAPIQGRRLVLG